MTPLKNDQHYIKFEIIMKRAVAVTSYKCMLVCCDCISNGILTQILMMKYSLKTYMIGSFINRCLKCWHSLLTSRMLDTFSGEEDSQNTGINILIRRRLSQVFYYAYVR